jgi:hypothetical protein
MPGPRTVTPVCLGNRAWYSDPSATAACATSLWICLAGKAEAVQVERDVGGGYIQARHSSDRTSNVAYELTVLSDGHRGCNRSTDLGRLDGSR